MEVCYVVIFEPQEVRAYSAELMVVTEREKFVVPVAAVGHRAVLDFPDQVRGFVVQTKTQPLGAALEPQSRYGDEPLKSYHMEISTYQYSIRSWILSLLVVLCLQFCGI